MERQIITKTPVTLAAREREIFNCLIEGMKTSEIAKKFDLKPNTVSTIKKVIFRKLDIHSSMELYKIALQNNLVKM
ncbi:MAG: helix-turn-helix transcriptional regulator [Bacteroidetes bacterium]|jgi:DNA-binding NarL/FixJ family response regulator|nr:helix-turn-helix transcriptional regulator [Bacteroidota bacterium]